MFPISNSEKKIDQNILTPLAFPVFHNFPNPSKILGPMFEFFDPNFRGADLTDISVLRLLDQVHISKNSNRSDRFYRVTLSYVGGSPFSKRQQYHIPGRYPGVLFSYYLSEKDYLTSLITFEPLFG